MTENEKWIVGFLVFPGFPMACLTSMIEPLRAANEIVGREVFAWSILSEDGQAVTSSARVTFQADAELSDSSDVDQLFLLSAPSSEFAHPAHARALLRKLARHGMALGAVSGGVFPLARSGLLGDTRVSVHWCYAAAFRQEFPQLQAVDDVISVDGRRTTVSGAAAAFDLALHLVAERLGQSVATEVACWFQHPLVRGHGVRQKIPTLSSDSTGDMLPRVVREAVEFFASRLDDPVKVADAAQAVGVSARQLERRFRKATGHSPLHYYRAMRMNAARQLVLYSNDSLSSIAVAVGYASSAPMVRHYREAHGIHPLADREKINLFRVRGNAAVPAAL